MSGLSRVDRSIKVIEFDMKKVMKYVSEMEQQLEISPKRKIFIGALYAVNEHIKDLLNRVKQQFNAHLGKLPPADMELEVSVLGALILEWRGLPSKKVQGYLRPEHFYDDRHQHIYQAVTELQDNVDMRTLAHRLREKGLLELIGGIYYIAELTSKVSSAVNVDFHARILVEHAVKRKIIETTAELLTESYEIDTDAISILEKAESKLKEAREWTRK
jgi:hypothetical protein